MVCVGSTITVPVKPVSSRVLSRKERGSAVMARTVPELAARRGDRV